MCISKKFKQHASKTTKALIWHGQKMLIKLQRSGYDMHCLSITTQNHRLQTQGIKTVKLVTLLKLSQLCYLG